MNSEENIVRNGLRLGACRYIPIISQFRNPDGCGREGGATTGITGQHQKFDIRSLERPDLIPDHGCNASGFQVIMDQCDFHEKKIPYLSDVVYFPMPLIDVLKDSMLTPMLQHWG
jgi:hypothetical protein